MVKQEECLQHSGIKKEIDEINKRYEEMKGTVKWGVGILVVLLLAIFSATWGFMWKIDEKFGDKLGKTELRLSALIAVHEATSDKQRDRYDITLTTIAEKMTTMQQKVDLLLSRGK